MTREEMRGEAIKIMCRAAGAFPEDMAAALDAVGAVGFSLVGPGYTEEQLHMGLTYFVEPLTAYDAIVAAGDLTRRS